MEFSGTFEFTDVDIDDVWLALSDPVLMREAIPGCQLLAPVEDDDAIDFDELPTAETDTASSFTEADPDEIRARSFVEDGQYAAVIGIKVGPVNPTFEAVGTITTREFPKMRAKGSGTSTNSSFEGEAGMTLSETEDGVQLEWWAETEVFGKIAQLGQRMINPVTERVVNRFFDKIGTQIQELNDAQSESDSTH